MPDTLGFAPQITSAVPIKSETADYFFIAVRTMEAQRLWLEAIQRLQQAGEEAKKSVKAAKQINEWSYRQAICESSRNVHLQLLRAELALERAKTEAQSVHQELLLKFRRAIHKAKSILLNVCHGLIKLGASIDGVRPNFLTNFLFPQPRNDAIYA